MKRLALIVSLPFALFSCIGDPMSFSYFYISNQSAVSLNVEFILKGGSGDSQFVQINAGETKEIFNNAVFIFPPLPSETFDRLYLWDLNPDNSRRSIVYTQDPVVDASWMEDVLQVPEPFTQSGGQSGINHYTFCYPVT